MDTEKRQQWERLNKSCIDGTSRREFEQAIKDGEQAAALAEELFGEASLELADTQMNLSKAYIEAGYRDGPMSLIGRAAAIAENFIDTNPEKASEIIQWDAEILYGLSVDDASEVQFKKALEIRKRHGLKPNLIAESLLGLAKLYFEADRKEEVYKPALEAKDLLDGYYKNEADKTNNDYIEVVHVIVLISRYLGHKSVQERKFAEAVRDYSVEASALNTLLSVGGNAQELHLDKFVEALHDDIVALSKLWPEGKSDLADLKVKLKKLPSVQYH